MMQSVQATQKAIEKNIADAKEKLDEVVKELVELYNKLKKKGVQGNKDALAVVGTRLNELVELCEKRLQELLEKLKESYEKNLSAEQRKRIETTVKNARVTVDTALSTVRQTYDSTTREGAKHVDDVSKRADELAKKFMTWGTNCTQELQSFAERVQKDHLSVSEDSFDQVAESYRKLSSVDVPLPSRLVAFIALVIQAFLVLLKTLVAKKETYATKAAHGAEVAHTKKKN
ncbi:hypothetical protein DIPPA_09321 [Diplonema papillatum]|nr:hypothetical protein DIPPA_09321 [Diplonema papillatum]